MESWRLGDVSYRNLLNLSGVGDDLLHDLHGLTLGLSCLRLTLSCGRLHDLDLLTLAHLHGHRSTLKDGEERRDEGALTGADTRQRSEHLSPVDTDGASTVII